MGLLTVKVTIAIPTHNRAPLLVQTIRSVTQIKIPQGAELECLVVDNNSTDDTPAVVESFVSKGSPFSIRRVLEQRQGSSYARNRAVDETDAEIILFIDDDVITDPLWATRLIAIIEQRGLDAACGLVVAKWPEPPPEWLGPPLYVKLAVHDPNAKDSRESLANYFSANAGFRRKTFEKFGRFRTDLGVVGGNPMSGEDTELFARIIDGGGKVGFAESAVVHHLITFERMRRAYFRHKSFAFGVGSAYKGGRSHNSFDKLGKNLIRMTMAAARGERALAFHHQLECINFLGYWRGRLMRRSSEIIQHSS